MALEPQTSPEGAANLDPAEAPAQPGETEVTSEDPQQKIKQLNKKVEKTLKARAETSKKTTKQLYNEWKRNVELRLGKIASQFSGGINVEDEVQTEINPDWFLTKQKTANLYSQVPYVSMTHENKQYAGAIPAFAKSLNYEISEKRMNVGVPMEEVLNDVVNAAGIGGIIVGYAARFQEVEVPVGDTKTIPPQMVQQLIQQKKIPTQMVPQVVSDKFFGTRISPVDLITPSEFAGYNFDDADFVGRRGRMSWAEAVNEFKLTEEDKEEVLQGTDVQTEDTLRSNPDKAGQMEAKNIKFEELYYWRHRFDPEEKYFTSIWRIVFVEGKDKAVIHEAWKGQKLVQETRKYIGANKFPIRILTLTYITDNPIPPSDSSASRPQVNDMRRSRSQMFQNRERSLPLRWFDSTRVDPLIQSLIMKGTWQGMIPSQGDGSRSFGEVARASYPSEDLAFDKQCKEDLMETWQVQPAPGAGRQTKDQAQGAQASFATRIGQERNRVAYFFLSICEVLAGLMALYSDFPILTEQERQQMMKAWDDKHITHDLVLKIRPDSTIVLEPGARLQKLMQFLNMTAKSGYVNAMPIITEMAELSGLDPSEVIVQPKPKEPDEPNMSFRFTGKDDIINPVVMALLVKHKQAPTPQELQDAIKILQAAQSNQVPQPPGDAPGAPPVGPGGPPGPHPPGPGGPAPGQDMSPEWSMANKVAKRSRDANVSGSPGGGQ